jgi:hypothetical protein
MHVLAGAAPTSAYEARRSGGPGTSRLLHTEMQPKRILVVYYSQSGDVAKILETFIGPIKKLPLDVTIERLEPVQPYPFPWRTLPRLLSIFPECHRGGGAGIRPLSIPPDRAFDLVILAYQVWFLAPSLPVQDFFKSEHAKVVRGAKVITLCVSRNMWHSCSETMKQMLHDAGAFHLDNVVVNHQGPPLATFVSVPRLLLFGKRDRFLGMFPPAEVSQKDLDRVRRLGQAVADQVRTRDDWSAQPLLTGMGAVHVNPRYIVPELVGWYLYQAGTGVVLFAERFGRWARRLAIYLFAAVLLLAVLTGVPLILLSVLVFYPFVFRRITRYAHRLAEPSGEA